jgi:hypothetical protein
MTGAVCVCEMERGGRAKMGGARVKIQQHGTVPTLWQASLHDCKPLDSTTCSMLV